MFVILKEVNTPMQQRPKHIKFHMGEEEQYKIKITFYNKSRFHGEIGCVDGTQVHI